MTVPVLQRRGSRSNMSTLEAYAAVGELSFDTIQRIGLKACEAGILACYVVDSLII